MDHVLYALDAQSGTEIWRYDGAQSALAAAPAFATSKGSETLYLGSLDGHLYAIQARTGDLLWEKEVDGGVWATPLVPSEAGQDASALYFGTLSGTVYALSTTDGSELWVQSVEGEVRGTPAYANGMIYVGCEDGKLYAFDVDSGMQGISPLGQQLERASIYASPVYDGRQLYIVATDGQVFALDPQENAIVWQTNPIEQD
jgi:outer membrane protein assembly factor BamB